MTSTRVPDGGTELRRLDHAPALDGLRAVGVIAVLGFHAKLPGFSGGKAGVDLFFTLSGFLITALLLQEHHAHGRIALKRFFVRRVLRLYPALLAAVAGAIFLAWLKIPVFDASRSSFDSTLRATPWTLLYGINLPRAFGWTGGGFLGHAWSLAIEEQFYLVWPPLVVLLLRRGRSLRTLGLVAAGAAATSAGARIVLDAVGVSSEGLYNFTFTHVDGIFAGCALAVFWRLRYRTVGRLARPGADYAALAVVVAVIVVGRAMNIVGLTATVVAGVVLIASVLERPASALARALSTRPLTAIGKRSYGLYVYHWPIFLFLGVDRRPHMLALGFGLSAAAAWISYRFVEGPFLRLKDRWRPAVPPAANV